MLESSQFYRSLEVRTLAIICCDSETFHTLVDVFVQVFDGIEIVALRYVDVALEPLQQIWAIR